MEDIDPSSVREEWRSALLADLEWFGLDHDELVWQSRCRPAHEALLDRLAATGRLYACSCSRSTIQKAGLPSAAGGWRYPGTCRAQRLTPDTWRNCGQNVRLDCSGVRIDLADESGLDLGQDLDQAMGDPLLVRADGSHTYQLAVVADDHASGVDRIVRGRDIASSTATQAAIRQLAGFPIPVYRHHLLLLEPHAGKLSKFHQSVGLDRLAPLYSPDCLRGFLARVAGILPPDSRDPAPALSPAAALALFDWSKVRPDDVVVDFDGYQLLHRP